MIAYFVYNLNKYSGAAQQALLLANHINKSIVIFNHQNGRFSKTRLNNRIQVINLPNNKIAKFFCIIYFSLINRVKIFHLHGFFIHGLLIGMILHKKTLVKTTLMGSDDLASVRKKVDNNLFFRFLLAQIDVNICLTNTLKRINEQYLDHTKIVVIPNMVLPGKGAATKQDAFCVVGLICKRKRTYESIKYFLDYYSINQSAQLYVIGPLEGVLEATTDYVISCKQLVTRNNAANQVIFTGHLAKEDVFEYLRRCKALLLFSENEGMPNVMLEAMAYNCVPITTGINGISREVLGDLDQRVTLQSLEDYISIDIIDAVIDESCLTKRVEKYFAPHVVAGRYALLYESLNT